MEAVRQRAKPLRSSLAAAYSLGQTRPAGHGRLYSGSGLRLSPGNSASAPALRAEGPHLAGGLFPHPYGTKFRGVGDCGSLAWSWPRKSCGLLPVSVRVGPARRAAAGGLCSKGGPYPGLVWRLRVALVTA